MKVKSENQSRVLCAPKRVNVSNLPFALFASLR
jgi:hypothetical protein